ncbi:MAG: hypothetical protein JW902_19350 [Syntrophaceae bacterium]|nr:hypothetical protein [Syntrophaceae bacterium]
MSVPFGPIIPVFWKRRSRQLLFLPLLLLASCAVLPTHYMLVLNDQKHPYSDPGVIVLGNVNVFMQTIDQYDLHRTLPNYRELRSFLVDPGKHKVTLLYKDRIRRRLQTHTVEVLPQGIFFIGAALHAQPGQVIAQLQLQDITRVQALAEGIMKASPGEIKDFAYAYYAVAEGFELLQEKEKARLYYECSHLLGNDQALKKLRRLESSRPAP